MGSKNSGSYIEGISVYSSFRIYIKRITQSLGSTDLILQIVEFLDVLSLAIALYDRDQLIFANFEFSVKSSSF